MLINKAFRSIHMEIYIQDNDIDPKDTISIITLSSYNINLKNIFRSISNM